MTTESFHKVPTRLDVEATVPGFYKAMAHLDTAAIREADRAGIPMGLRDLLRLRASQINLADTANLAIGDKETDAIGGDAARLGGRRPHRRAIGAALCP